MSASEIAKDELETGQVSTRSPATKKPADDTKPFRFLDLPPEIRNSIYKLVLVKSTKDKPLRIADRLWVPPYRRDREGHRQLLAVSRAVRKEALTIYYSNNSVNHVGPGLGLYRWFSAIGTEATQSLMSLTVEDAAECKAYRYFELRFEAHMVGSKKQRRVVVEGREKAVENCVCDGTPSRKLVRRKWEKKCVQLAAELREYGLMNVELLALEATFGRLCSKFER